MGEPGTKEVLNLADLEAAGGIHTGRKHILSLLVENKPGVLARIAGLFSRRGFNIQTLAVGPTDDPTLSRMTLTVDGALQPIDQVTKQLHNLVNVIKIRDLEPDETVARELAPFHASAPAAPPPAASASSSRTASGSRSRPLGRPPRSIPAGPTASGPRPPSAAGSAATRLPTRLRRRRPARCGWAGSRSRRPARRRLS